MARRMLAVIDYQNDFVNGTLGFEGAEKLDDGIVDLITEYKENDDVIVVTMDVHDEDYLLTREGKALPIEHCRPNTSGVRIYGKTGQKLLEYCGSFGTSNNIMVIPKCSFGIHPTYMCELVEQFDDIEEIVVVGLITNICVVSNICCLQAAYPNAQIIVYASLVDSFNKDLHNKTLDVLRGMQVSVED